MSKSDRPYAYAGKILRVDLTSRSFTTEPIYPYLKDWLGSSGIAIKMLYDELRPWVTPFDPRNMLIFGTGALQGTPTPGACKMTANTLGPLTGGWATGASDSHIGGQLKCAGYDILVITGKAHKPVYLLIEDDKIEILDASHLWGKLTSESLSLLRETHKDPNLHALLIGPGGENLVKGACVLQDENRAFGRCGTGAVMGSKNLKAIVAYGSGGIGVAQPDRFFSMVHELQERAEKGIGQPGLKKYGTLGILEPKQEACGIAYKNYQETKLPDEMAKAIDPKKTIDKYRIGYTCFPGCLVGCGQVVHFTEGPYAGLKTTNNQWEVLCGIQGRLAVWEPHFMFKANHYCNELGLDVDLVGGVIGWAMECYQRGIITRKDTDGLSLEWGDTDVILELTRKIAYREGFGNLLAEGSARAADILGRESSYYALHIKGQDLYEACRGAMGFALGVTTATRGGGHTSGASVIETFGDVDTEKMSQIYGLEKEDLDPLGYKGKPKLVWFTEVLHRISNTLGICFFNTCWSNLNAMGLEEMAELYSAASGIEITQEELKKIGVRQLNMEKALNSRHTNFCREDDMPASRDLNEPIPTGRLAGWKIDKTKWDDMLDEYYSIHGWERETGLIKRSTLEELGLSYVADELTAIGKIALD